MPAPILLATLFLLTKTVGYDISIQIKDSACRLTGNMHWDMPRETGSRFLAMMMACCQQRSLQSATLFGKAHPTLFDPTAADIYGLLRINVLTENSRFLHVRDGILLTRNTP